MRATFIAIAILALLTPSAQAADGPDITVELDADGAGPDAAPELRLRSWEPGERALWDVDLAEAFTTIEIRANGFALEHPRQLTPMLERPSTYPVFEVVPFDDVWNAEAAAPIAHVGGNATSIVLRLGIPGPFTGVLNLSRDVTPPVLTVGERNASTHYSFYQETRTDEYAIVDLQVRKLGSDEWVRNPTPVHHVFQRFPVQGLDADAEYETRYVVTDWAGNVVVVDGAPHRTLPAPSRNVVEVKPVSPTPNATIARGDVNITAEFPSGLTLQDGGVRLFLDKREIRENLAVVGNRITYAPPSPLARGPHSVSVEVTGIDESHGEARWTFHVGPQGTPSAPLAFLLLALAIAGMVARR